MATQTAEPDPLNDAILAAHAASDKAALATLYRKAADRLEPADEDQLCFLLTQAYIFALDAGTAEAENLHRRLVSLGRER
ncbi:hypothetical protein AADZ90_013460 [Aestuariibius sp. 2305UL40-4]|uniref:hypothetical protein n=1 Tax=Aestuariibius violaceus TaxID=3234132 RepID=UPI00345E452D